MGDSQRFLPAKTFGKEKRWPVVKKKTGKKEGPIRRAKLARPHDRPREHIEPSKRSGLLCLRVSLMGLLVERGALFKDKLLRNLESD